MKARHYIIGGIAVLLALPALVTPGGWAVAAILVVGWLALSVGGPWAANRYLDLKEEREAGLKRKQLEDRLGGTDDDHRRWRR